MRSLPGETCLSSYPFVGPAICPAMHLSSCHLLCLYVAACLDSYVFVGVCLSSCVVVSPPLSSTLKQAGLRASTTQVSAKLPLTKLGHLTVYGCFLQLLKMNRTPPPRTVQFPLLQVFLPNGSKPLRRWLGRLLASLAQVMASLTFQKKSNPPMQMSQGSAFSSALQ